MKFFVEIKFIFKLLFMFNIINCQFQQQPLFKCEHNDYEERHPLPYTLIKHDETFKRKIEGESDFVDFQIYLDFANLEKDMETYGLSNKKNFFETSMTNAAKTLKTLLKVKPLDIGNGNSGYNIYDEHFAQIGISYWDKDKFGNEAISKHKTFQSQNIHLAIFATLDELSESTLATASAKVYQSENGQPLVGLVKINKDVDYSKLNSDFYFKTILVHEFTHILGFSQYFFENYFHNTFTEDDDHGISRIYITSPTLLTVAKKYFNCDNIEGVELENQGGEGTAGSHWEARILLGEYMNGYAYTEEQVISEFTLAVLEDSGYYKANYYTGGLMRYGKNKGCEFLKEKCVISNEINSKFENEFFDSIAGVNSVDSSCSSGRQSRTYNYFVTANNLLEEYQYFEDPNVAGYEPADFCPVPRSYKLEEDKSYYVGHCSSKGSGEYGTLVYYGDNYDSSSKNVNKYTGETLSDHSFCYLSSLSKTDLISTVVRANCYETFCSDQSLTIKIFDDYIVCPRAGGKIEVDGYDGYLLCPDYNLICSGTVICNTIFDCVDKKSEVKEESYIYDYTIKTSQNLEEASLTEIDYTDNYELSENGKCPQYCKHCQDKSICLKCVDDYGKKLETDKSIKCYKLEEFEEGYYQNDQDVYIKCIDNCIICEDARTCSKCKEGFFYFQKKCVEMPEDMETIENCLQYSDQGVCIKCEYGYGFSQNKKDKCLKIEEEFKNYYTKDNISFFPCSNYNINCSECFYNKTEYKVKCTLCKDNLILLEIGNGQCLNIQEIQQNEKYYLIDETHAKSCSKVIENCVSCDNGDYCLQCKPKYEYDSNQNKCVDPTRKIKEEGSDEINNDNKNKTRKSRISGCDYFFTKNIILLESIYFIFLLI